MEIKRVIVVGDGSPRDQEVISALAGFKVTYVIENPLGGHLFQGSTVADDFFVHHGDVAVVLTDTVPTHLGHKMPLVSPYSERSMWNAPGHKVLWKKHAKDHNILTPHTFYIRGHDLSQGELSKLHSQVFLPVNIKTSKTNGNLAYDFDVFASSLRDTMAQHGHAYIERHIQGRTMHVCTLRGFRGRDIYVTPVVEKVGDKYHIVHKLDSVQKKYIEDAARLLHSDLGLGHVAQFDFIITPKHVYLQDIHAHPVVDQGSPLLESLHSVGSSLVEFWKLAIEHSRAEFRKKGRLS